jgi:hypothetical protein
LVLAGTKPPRPFVSVDTFVSAPQHASPTLDHVALLAYTLGGTSLLPGLEDDLPSLKRVEWPLVVCSIVLAAIFGLACAFDEDGDLALTVCQVEHPSRPPDEVCRALSLGAVARLLAGPSARERVTPPGLLAAVPGGLCLLI